VIDDWIRHRYIYHVPSAVLAVGLEIIAIVLLAVVLILDSIAHQDKCIFERDLLQQNERKLGVFLQTLVITQQFLLAIKNCLKKINKLFYPSIH
jgi:hypothetical protein